MQLCSTSTLFFAINYILFLAPALAAADVHPGHSPLLAAGNFSFSLAMARQLYGKNRRLRRSRQPSSGGGDATDNTVGGSETSSLASSIAGSMAGDEARNAPARAFLRLPVDADGAGIKLICTSFDTNDELHEK